VTSTFVEPAASPTSGEVVAGFAARSRRDRHRLDRRAEHRVWMRVRGAGGGVGARFASSRIGSGVGARFGSGFTGSGTKVGLRRLL
jgi:hypothetical protein